jgi:hypothetical protein
MDKFDIAWNNAFKIEGLNPKQFRVCYICEIEMNHGTKWDSETNPQNGWNIDHVDGNNKNNNHSNLVATHYECNVKKGNRNYTNKYNEAKKYTYS